jgi:hypothetical protein
MAEREREDIIDVAFRVFERHQYEHFGRGKNRVLIDAMTAGAIVAVYRALSPANREKYRAMAPARVAAIAWKLVS